MATTICSSIRLLYSRLGKNYKLTNTVVGEREAVVEIEGDDK